MSSPGGSASDGLLLAPPGRHKEVALDILEHSTPPANGLHIPHSIDGLTQLGGLEGAYDGMRVGNDPY